MYFTTESGILLLPFRVLLPLLKIFAKPDTNRCKLPPSVQGPQCKELSARSSNFKLLIASRSVQRSLTPPGRPVCCLQL